MKIFIICSVRGVDESYRKMLESYCKELEQKGNEVHLPHRNTYQNNTEIGICGQNRDAIKWSNEVHVFYNSLSQGTHFDLGMAFALNKPIKVIENESETQNKSFSNMIRQWEKRDIKYEN
jgi:nucleoside 2-deoxyribosyltransferase